MRLYQRYGQPVTKKRIIYADEQDCKKVSVAYTKENAIKYPNSLLSDDRYVYKGLPEEYVEDINLRY